MRLAVHGDRLTAAETDACDAKPAGDLTILSLVRHPGGSAGFGV